LYFTYIGPHLVFFFFFFQAEDGIRDRNVTGVQTCALPICILFRRIFLRSVLDATAGKFLISLMPPKFGLSVLSHFPVITFPKQCRKKYHQFLEMPVGLI